MNNYESVFKFKLFFEDGDMQTRFVVAKGEDEAIDKMEEHIAYLAENAFEVPIHYTEYPTVELYCVLV